jgi:hypothetical protein
VVVTVGARGGTILYARDDVALGHDAGVEKETDTPSAAYAPFPKWNRAVPPPGVTFPGIAS